MNTITAFFFSSAPTKQIPLTKLTLKNNSQFKWLIQIFIYLT